MFNSNPNFLLKSKRDSQSLYLPEKQKQKAIKTQNDTGEKKSLGLKISTQQSHLLSPPQSYRRPMNDFLQITGA